MKKISIIVPVYNVEKYLKDSIESLISQTIFKELEIILIDDGSVDNSYNICKHYAEKYQNIIAYTQENGGVSSARNEGVKLSTGEYIAFFDSDDLVKEDTYETLYNLIVENNSDISMVDFSFIREGKEFKKRKKIQVILDDKEKILSNFLSGSIFVNSVCDKLFKREVISGAKFPIGYSVGEDMYFQYLVLKNANRVVVDTSYSKYMYVVRENSAMTNTFSNRFFDTTKLSEKIVEDCKKENRLIENAEAHEIHEICKVLEYMYLAESEENFTKERNKLLDKVKEYSLVQGYRFLSKRQFIGLCLMKVNPKLYITVFKRIQKIK